jgi:hypothetical protein
MINKIIYLFILVLIITGCTFKLSGGRSFGYSLTGASTSGAQTALVTYFTNNALTVEPSLAQKLTDALKNEVISQTNLSLAVKDGDVTLEGSVTGFDYRPQGISGGNSLIPNSNRLTVTLKVKYTNIKDHHFDYDQSFSRYIDEVSTLTLDQVVASSDYTTLINQLADDIFQKAFVNW